MLRYTRAARGPQGTDVMNALTHGAAWSRFCRLTAPVLVAALAVVGCDDSASSDDQPRCGNGVVEGFEQCDDGNDDPGDGCHLCRHWEPIEGAPLTGLVEGAWSWVEVPGAICRDGSPAGFSINPGARADDVVVYFEGGGACFETLNCLANPPSIPEQARSPFAAGIFDRDNPDNPVGDWTWVYLPYCSGDVFAGSTSDVLIEGHGLQQFQGDRNMRLFLERLVPTLPDVDRLLVTGISAGGMAAHINTERLARAFRPRHTILLNDGGPPLPSEWVPVCLQEHWRALWNLDDSTLADCGAACSPNGNYLLDIAASLGRRDDVPVDEERTLGVFSFDTDAVVRLLYSFGQNDCRMSPIPLMGAGHFRAGLDAMRQQLADRGVPYATFLAAGEAHTCIQSNCLYTTVQSGESLVDWVADLVQGVARDVIAP